jgi:hypothetical protein
MPSFTSKMANISSNMETEALVAAIFIFSVRFLQDPGKDGGPARPQVNQGDLPSILSAYDLARRRAFDALEEYGDEIPSLGLLQALILITFHQLTRNAQGTAWRSLGMCIRITYEMKLHLVDNDRSYTGSESPDYDSRFVEEEERRRAFWAVWELDVFASTIRRLPTGLDLRHTETFLPIDDKAWFEGTYQKSCRLDLDPTIRWKTLKQSGNQSWRAWYIVLNSMMRDAHLLSYAKGTYGFMGSYEDLSNPSRGATAWTLWRSSDTVWKCLKRLEESLACFWGALPSQYCYHKEYLGFHSSIEEDDSSALREDCAKHALFAMMQLSKFMIYPYEMFWAEQPKTPPDPHDGARQQRLVRPTVNVKAWAQYLESADNIVRLIRNSSPYHVRYVNPLFASTMWLAAVAQIVSKTLNNDPQNVRVAQSKFEVLQHNFNSYVTLWNSSEALQQKLNTLEARMQRAKYNWNKDVNVIGNIGPQCNQSTSQIIDGESIPPCAIPASHDQYANRNETVTDTTMRDLFTTNLPYDFESCGLFGLPADMINSTWPTNSIDMIYDPTDVYNYEIQDFLNYSSNVYQ